MSSHSLFLPLFLHTFHANTQFVFVNTLAYSLRENLETLKKLLPSEDILTYTFQTADGIDCAICYADGMVNKELLGDLIARPLSRLNLYENLQNNGGRYALNNNSTQKQGGMYALNKQESADDNDKNRLFSVIKKAVLFPELKQKQLWQDCVKEVLDGNALLFIDTLRVGLIIGAKFLPVRAVTEPPTDVAVKGPREGFIEDIKTNMSLVRKRLKTPNLLFETVRVGKQSDTAVTICYLKGIVNEEVKKQITEKLHAMQIDNIPDSSYIAAMLSPRRRSVFHSVGTTEKPDIFCAKIAEGRVGILVDGSPIALTLPFLLTENLQSSEDYFISPFMATIFRCLRFFSLVIAILLPAFYICAQLFKMQLLPLGLMLTIASGVRELPFSPSIEMFVVLFLLEVLKEASVRMPKYVGMSLSVVGALVLGETAVSAGFLSTPAIIIVAFSGICLYTVPNFVETGSILRWLFLLVAGSLGPFGVVLTAAFLLYYVITSDAFGAPLLAPFSPFIAHDLRDTLFKYDMASLKTRPKLLRGKNKTRMRLPDEKS